MEQSEQSEQAPIKVKNKGGRPKGSKQQSGLSLEKRLKILSRIATDTHGKASDIINACREITSLLNDKIKETKEGLAETVLSFEIGKPITTSKKQVEKAIEANDNKETTTESTPITITNTTTTTITQVVAPQVVTESNSIEFDFTIDPSQTIDIDDETT